MQELLSANPDVLCEKFGEVIESSQEVYESDLDALLKTLYKIEKLTAGEPHRCKELRMKAIDHYFMQRMSEKFPRISPALFELERTVRLEVKGNTRATLAVRILTQEESTKSKVVDVKCPLFALSEIGKARVELGRYANAKPQADFRICASLPKGIVTARNWSRDAEAHALRIKADLLQCDELSYGDCKSIDKPNPNQRYPRPSGAYVAWIPKLEFLFLEEVVIPKGDPAMLYRFGEEYYLCGLWDIPEEEPGEAVLREYTEGSGKVKKKRVRK
ncbi:MAG: hypothetical protein AAF497_09915 [Planctomycetota bacterium]